jgi:hypothetical protein
MAHSTPSRARRGRLGVVFAVLAIVAVFLVVGFLAGWFGFNSSETQTQFTIDRAEMREDIDAAAESSRELVNESAEAVRSATEDDAREP